MSMTSRIGTAALVCAVATGCGAGADGDLQPGRDEAAGEATTLGDDDVSTAPAAATGCVSVTSTLAEHVARGRATQTFVPVLFFVFSFYYSTSNPPVLIGTDPNQRVTLYPASAGYTSDPALCVGTNVCGDGIVQGTEQCDDTVPPSTTCESLGYAGSTGTPGCTAACSLDTSPCAGPVCGNGLIEPGEQCDGANLGQATTCQGLMPGVFGSGNLACTPTCSYDLTSCQKLCGNGVLDPGEACDGTLFSATYAGRTCADMAYPYPTWPIPIIVSYASGNLTCSNSCGVDYGQCKARPGCYSVSFKGQFGLQCI